MDLIIRLRRNFASQKLDTSFYLLNETCIFSQKMLSRIDPEVAFGKYPATRETLLLIISLFIKGKEKFYIVLSLG